MHRLIWATQTAITCIAMCFAILFVDPSPRFKLVLLFNRDEVLDRPTKPAHFWLDFPHILGGRDEVRLGTWLGISRNGRFAFLTNYRERDNTLYTTTRGDLTANFLKSTTTAQHYLASLQPQEYAGFNLVVGSVVGDEGLWYFTNRGPIEQQGPFKLEPGVHCLSNSGRDARWHKMVHGVALAQRLLKDSLHSTDQVPWNQMYDLLSDTTTASATTLLPDTGWGADFEQAASSIFMQPFQLRTGSLFGTRSQTVLCVSQPIASGSLRRSDSPREGVAAEPSILGSNQIELGVRQGKERHKHISANHVPLTVELRERVFQPTDRGDPRTWHTVINSFSIQ